MLKAHGCLCWATSPFNFLYFSAHDELCGHRSVAVVSFFLRQRIFHFLIFSALVEVSQLGFLRRCGHASPDKLLHLVKTNYLTTLPRPLLGHSKIYLILNGNARGKWGKNWKVTGRALAVHLRWLRKVSATSRSDVRRSSRVACAEGIRS
jgi:hypothetical protein